MPNEVGEHVEALRPQPDVAPVPQEGAARRIEDETAKGQGPAAAPPVAENARLS